MIYLRHGKNRFLENYTDRRDFMPLFLSLQGSMAAGKTTAARYLEACLPEIHVSYEANQSVIKEIRRRGLNKNKYEDYLEIQKLWLMNEVRRWEACKGYPCTVMDFGAEEIVFYTLNYPRSMGLDWDVETPLREELERIQVCLPQRILFLDASEEWLRKNKEGDETRSREFFEYYVKHMMPLKRKWFSGRENVDFLKTDGMTIEEMGQAVKKWAEEQRKR